MMHRHRLAAAATVTAVLASGAVMFDAGSAAAAPAALGPTASGQVAPKPIASPLENQLAMNDLINSLSFGVGAGSLVGTSVGAAIGVGVGLAAAAASCTVISIGCVLVVLPAATLLGGAGGVAGLALGGAPGLAAGLWNYYQTVTAPPGTSQYASQIPALHQPARTRKPIASPLENQLAANDSLQKFGAALTLGPLGGTAAGALVGAAVAVGSCAVVGVACVATALPTVAALAGAGGVLGTIGVGGAAAAYGAWNYLSTLAAPPNTSRYAGPGGAGANDAGVPNAVFRLPRLPSGSATGSAKV